MSDNDSITNSNGSVGCWTRVIPEESPVETVGPGDDGIECLAQAPSATEKVTWSGAAREPAEGTDSPEWAESEDGQHDEPPAPPEAPAESLGPEDDGRCSPAAMPSLSADVTGSVAEEQRGDGGLPTETALSEEGLQVCQETGSEGSAPSSPAVLSPSPSSHVPLISDQESHTPFSLHADAYAVPRPCSDTNGLAADIPAHDIYTHTSPAPEDLAADIPAHEIDTHTCPAPEDLAADIPAHDIYTHTSPAPEDLAADIPAHDIYTHTSPAPEDLAADIPAHEMDTHTSPAPEDLAPVSSASDSYTDTSPTVEPPVLKSQSLASIPPASILESLEREEPQREEVVSETAEILADVAPQEDFRGDSDQTAEEAGLRRRHAPPSASPEPLLRARDEEEEEEEEEFHLIEKKKKEEGGWVSLNKCIVGALVLLCLGSIIFTGCFLDLDDEEDSAQPRDQELHGKQEWLNPDAKLPDPKEVSQLLGKLSEDNQQMAILQAQKAELDLALQKVEEAGMEPPTGMTENHTSVHGGLWEEPKAPASEEGHTGPGGVEMGGGPEDGAREEEDERTTERMEKPVGRDGERKIEWEGRVREVRREGHHEKEWKKGREEGKEWRQREERKEKKEESDWKHRKEGLKDKHREWKEKVERRRAWEKARTWYKGGERKREGAWKDRTERKDPRHDGWRGERKEKDWKVQKEGWKAQRAWREEERGSENNKGWKEKRWQGSAEKKPRALDRVDYWERQRERLRKNRPPADCRSAAECAGKEGLVPVKQAEFQGLLGSYLGKLGDAAARENGGAVVSLVGEFFADGVFTHQKVPFREFVEDLADVLEDLVEGDRRAEEEMEQFEREALRKFAVAGGGEREGGRRRKDGRMWG